MLFKEMLVSVVVVVVGDLFNVLIGTKVDRVIWRWERVSAQNPRATLHNVGFYEVLSDPSDRIKGPSNS